VRVRRKAGRPDARMKRGATLAALHEGHLDRRLMYNIAVSGTVHRFELEL